MEDQVSTKTAPAPVSVAGSFSRLVGLLRMPLYANAFYLWVSAAGTALGGLAFWALVARLYDAEDVGPGSAALSILTLLAIFSHLGLGLGLIRFLPESGAQGPRLANAVFTTSGAGAVVLSVVFLRGIPSGRSPRCGEAASRNRSLASSTPSNRQESGLSDLVWSVSE